MANGRKTLSTEKDTGDEIVNNSQSDLSSEDELATAFDSVSFGFEREESESVASFSNLLDRFLCENT